MLRRSLLAILLCLPAGGALASAPKEDKKKGGGATYIQIQPMSAIAVRRDGRRGVLSVETGVDIADAALRERAEMSLPRLRASYVQVLQTYAAGLTPGSPPNAEYLSRELQRQTDIVLGKPGAKLLLGAIVVN